MRKNIGVGFLAVVLICCLVRESRGMEPYDNIAMPQGSYFSDYPLYYHADRLMDKNGDAVATNPEAVLYQNMFKYTYYDKTLLPNTDAFAALLPVGCMELLGDHRCGVGDLTLVGSYWLVDNPESKTWFGPRLQVVAPIGSYDKNSKANMGGRGRTEGRVYHRRGPDVSAGGHPHTLGAVRGTPVTGDRSGFPSQGV